MSAQDRIRDWLRQHLGKTLGVGPAAITFDRTLADYGLDSVDAILIAGEFEDAFGVEIDPTTFIRYDNFDAMINDLAQRLTP